MLAAPEQRVKGDRWFALIDKVYAERNLPAASQQVAKNDGAAGIDQQQAADWLRPLPEAIWELSDKLRADDYVPSSIKRVHIPKPGTTETRPLGIPTVRDRIVQAAIVNVIEPIFERDFAEHSDGFRPGRGCRDALRRRDPLIGQGHHSVVDADRKGDFDTIPHDLLMARVSETIADGKLPSLIEAFLKAPIQDGSNRIVPTAGPPQGAVRSPLLSNIHLNPLDHLMQQSGSPMVRYADDYVILCRTADEAATALDLVTQWTADNGLTLHPTKTKIVDVGTEGFDFLGYHFRDHRHWPREKSLKKPKDTLPQKTRRTSGDSLPCVIAKPNQTLRGWFASFQHSSYRTILRDLDKWLRMRLRSLLRKRRK